MCSSRTTPRARARCSARLSRLVIPVGITFVTFMLGLHVFNRIAPKVAEDL